MTYPNGFLVQRSYTARGQLQIVRDSSQQKLVEYTYLKDGKVDFQDYANGVRSAFGYNGRGMIASVHHKRNASGANLSYRDYWRDERDRITAWKRSTDNALNGMEDGRGDRYQYDAEGQLEQASYRALSPEGTPSQVQRTDIFHYDALGNREGSNYLANRGTMSFPRRNNGLNQYAGWMPYSPILYDDPALPDRGNGVLAENGWISATYNALNQPMGMWSSAYGSTNYVWFGYDPLGRCVKRWVSPAVGTFPNQHAPPANTNPATYYYYEGWNLIQEGPNATTADRVYVHGNRVDEIVASSATGAGWLYHHYDARGHCILQTNASGGLQEQYDYDAFGWPYFYTATGAPAKVYGKPGSPSGNRFLFTGREFLSRLRIYDFRNRLYQPELGRFLQPDPTEFEAGDYNLYRYCHNDPVNRSDPTGLISFTGNVEKQHLAPVLGTNIKQWVTFERIPISFTTSGNYMDANAAHHVVDAASPLLGGDKGRTYLTGAVTEGNNSSGAKMLSANLNIDYYTKATRYDPLEREHTFGVEGGGSKTKGVLESGGIWDRFRNKWAGGTADFFARWRLQQSLNGYISDAKTEQGGTWDAPGGPHRVPW